jgi:oxygen-dependent protoporphyrinogen oxidase
VSADPRVAIVGGGISGLAAAYELTRLGVSFVLIERAPQCGGVVVTERIGGYTIDAGPDALLTQKPGAIDLCRELAIDTRLRAQASHTTYVVRGGCLRPLPEASVMGIPTRWSSFATSDAFSWPGKLRMAAEVCLPARSPREDESIASFIGRRFGREAVEYLAEPLLAGIHGGDPSSLSMRASFPRLIEMEASSRSVIAGLRRAATPASRSRPPLVALPGGMSELTAALVHAIPARAIRTGIAVQAITRLRGGYALQVSDRETFDVPAVVMATPPSMTGRLLHGVDRELTDLCRRIRAASVATIALGYRRASVTHPLNGTGFVVPRVERARTRAVSWVSSKWTDRAPADRVLLRAYVGSINDPAAVDLADDALVATAQRDIAPLLGIREGPELARVYRWRDAIPQLEVGHATLMQTIDDRLRMLPGLFVSATGFRGTGIADCVADARHQASRAAAYAVSSYDFARASSISDRTRSAFG